MADKYRRPMIDYRPHLEEIMARVDGRRSIDQETGCWNWTGGKSRIGYGMITFKQVGIAVHRLVFAAYNGPFDVDLDVCHSCDNRACFNPAHLRADTHKNNQREAGDKKRMQGQWKTHCLRGHPLEGDNLRKYSKFRGCRECERQRQRERWHKSPEFRQYQKDYRAKRRTERHGSEA